MGGKRGVFGAPMATPRSQQREPALKAWDAPWRDDVAQTVSGWAGKLGFNERNAYQKTKGALSVADWVPGVGDAAGYADAAGSFKSGNYLRGAVQAGLSTVGLVPGVGDLAAAGGKGLVGKFLGAAMVPGAKKLTAPAADAIERVLYRGTNGSSEKIRGGIAEGTPFAARERMYAELYGDNIEQIGVKKGARILREGTGEFKKVTGRRHGMLIRGMRPGENMATAGTMSVAQAKAAGYDGVEFHSGEDGIALINPNMFVRNHKP